MNRMKIIIATIGALAVIIVVLLYNKSQTESKSKTDIQTSIPVSVTTVGRQKVSDVRSLVGTIAANNDVAIISETQGKVTAVTSEIGDYKQAGAALIQVDDELKKANLASAEVNYEKAKKDLERYESLYKQNSATDQQLEAARLAAKAAEAQYVTAHREYSDTKITTPISGIVTSRLVDVGTYVQKGIPVANVVDISVLKVRVNVAEHDVFRMKVGDKVEVTTDVYPGVKFQGRIRTMSSKADDAHTYPIEIVLNNTGEHPLKAGMFGQVSFLSGSNNDMLTIPRGALVGSMKNPQVFVVEGTVARLRDISVSSEFGTQLAVLSGLKQGEIVVLSGQNNLKDSIAVTIIK
jgi:RND family efflux transporter MFP subunit